MRKGQLHTEETKRKISLSLIGNTPWNKGKHGLQEHSEETRRKMSESHKGQIPWNKGLAKETDIRVRKIAEKLKGQKPSEKTREKMRIAQLGHTHGFQKGVPSWNRGLTKDTDSRVKRVSNSLLGDKNPMYGKSLSEENRKKLSIAFSGENNPMYGKTGIRSPMYGRTGKDAPMYGRQHSEETRRKISEALSGENNPNYGKTGKNNPLYGRKHTKKAKQKMREARLKRVFPKKDTSIEVALQKELDKRKITYKKHIPICGVCQPDIVFPSVKLAIFADGDYWHSKDFKDGKVWRRDRHQDEVLRENGWVPLRFWGSEIRSSVSECAEQVISMLERT